MIKEIYLQSLRNYVSNNRLKNKVLYPKNKNIIKNVYNYMFKRYGTLHIVKHDKLWIFNIHSQGYCIMSLCSNNDFNTVDIAYRNISNGIPLKFHRNSMEREFKIARGERKEQLFNLFMRMLNNLE